MASSKLCGALLLSQLVGNLAINEGAFGKPLEYPPVISSSGTDVQATLNFAEYEYRGPGLVAKTRAYNDALTGPTIRAKPGQTIKMKLINNLPKPPVDTNAFHNICRDPDKTNMHPHGLHVSSNAPGDNVFVEVESGGGEYDYEYRIPPDHMGGTFWYHAHHHGSTNLQAGGGGGGFIIIEDAPGALPAHIAALEEIPMLLANLDLPSMYRWSNICIQQCSADENSDIGKIRGTPAFHYDNCTATFGMFAAGGMTKGGSNTYSNGLPAVPDRPILCAGDAAETKFGTDGEGGCPDTNTVLVNGMSEPIIPMVANRWYRWRMIFGAVQSTISPKLEGCEMGLLAKDGVYLDTAPRPITAGFMAPGNRADWLVRCPAGAFSFVSNGLIDPGFAGGPNANFGLNRGLVQVLATVVATEKANEQTCDLGTFSAARPCYLADLTGVSGTALVPPTVSTEVAFPGLGISNNIDGAVGCPIPGDVVSCRFNRSHVFSTFTTGTINEYRVKGLWAHPFHTHVNPFQLGMTPEYNAEGYFMKGDFHDTLLLPNMKPNTEAAGWDGLDANGDAKTVQGSGRGFPLLTNTDMFKGDQVFHCHFLEHEDQGMMANILMDGTEGARFDVSSFLANGEKCYSATLDPATDGPVIHKAPTCTANFDNGVGGVYVEWDDPALTITFICAFILFFLLIVLGMVFVTSSKLGGGKGKGANKDVQFTSVSTPPA